MHENVRRAIVRGFYPGPGWQARVMAMSDEEVKLIHDLKVEQVREQGATDMQLQKKAESR
jgi:hypothetical protein